MEEREFRGRLITVRIIWAAMLMGLVMFMVVALTRGTDTQTDPKLLQLLLYVAIGMLAVLTPVGLLVRALLYRGGRDENGVVSGQAYATGNIVFFAMMEGVAMLAITGGMLAGGRGAHFFVALVAMVIMLVSFPTGRAMRGDERIQPMHRR